jgi:DNA-binding NtrC family response regulator
MNKRILIVEDDAIIGMLLEEYIDMLGHRCAATVDRVDDALAKIAEGGIDAAVVDVHLADGDVGDAIAAALSENDIPFLVATGGFVGETGSAWRGRPILAKPFTLDDLRDGLGRL